MFVQNFGAPSFDDKKLEVVAVFGSMQMAMSRVINIQHHRIAQVRTRQDRPLYKISACYFVLTTLCVAAVSAGEDHH